MCLNHAFMFKIDDFFEKTGVFRKKIKMKFAGPVKNWLYLGQKLLLTRFFWLKPPLYGYLFLFTPKNTHHFV